MKFKFQKKVIILTNRIYNIILKIADEEIKTFSSVVLTF